jgi:hypothetical protein
VLSTISNALCSTRSRINPINIYYELKINEISNVKYWENNRVKVLVSLSCDINEEIYFYLIIFST